MRYNPRYPKMNKEHVTWSSQTMRSASSRFLQLLGSSMRLLDPSFGHCRQEEQGGNMGFSTLKCECCRCDVELIQIHNLMLRNFQRVRYGDISLFAIWGVDPLGLDPIPFKSQKKTKSQKFMSDCGITKRQYWSKRNCGHERFFPYQSNADGISSWSKLWQPI